MFYSTEGLTSKVDLLLIFSPIFLMKKDLEKKKLNLVKIAQNYPDIADSQNNKV